MAHRIIRQLGPSGGGDTLEEVLNLMDEIVLSRHAVVIAWGLAAEFRIRC